MADILACTFSPMLPYAIYRYYLYLIVWYSIWIRDMPITNQHTFLSLRKSNNKKNYSGNVVPVDLFSYNFLGVIWIYIRVFGTYSHLFVRIFVPTTIFGFWVQFHIKIDGQLFVAYLVLHYTESQAIWILWAFPLSSFVLNRNDKKIYILLLLLFASMILFDSSMVERNTEKLIHKHRIKHVSNALKHFH